MARVVLAPSTPLSRAGRDETAVRARCADLLLKSKENDHDIKLADFGFAKKCDGRSLDMQCGTPGYERSLSLQRLEHVSFVVAGMLRPRSSKVLSTAVRLTCGLAASSCTFCWAGES